MTDAEIRALNLAMAALCGYLVITGARCPDGTHIHDLPDEYQYGGLRLYRAADDTGWGVWSPATNPAQAMEVAEALRRQGWNTQITLYTSGANACEIRWNGVGEPPGSRCSHMLSGGTPAEAMCFAAAKTLPSDAGR